MGLWWLIVRQDQMWSIVHSKAISQFIRSPIFGMRCLSVYEMTSIRIWLGKANKANDQTTKADKRNNDYDRIHILSYSCLLPID